MNTPLQLNNHIKGRFTLKRNYETANGSHQLTDTITILATLPYFHLILFVANGTFDPYRYNNQYND